MESPVLDPEIAAFVAEMQRAWAEHPPFMSLPFDEARAIGERVRARWAAGGPAMARTSEHRVPTPSGPVRIRVYDPGLDAPAPEAPAEAAKPAVSVKKSVRPDYIVCLEDGKRFKSQKRHLRTRYDMSPAEYRE